MSQLKGERRATFRAVHLVFSFLPPTATRTIRVVQSEANKTEGTAADTEEAASSDCDAGGLKT